MDFTTLPFIFQHSLSMNIQIVLLHEPGNNLYFFTQNFLCISLSVFFSLSSDRCSTLFMDLGRGYLWLIWTGLFSIKLFTQLPLRSFSNLLHFLKNITYSINFF